MMQYKACCNLNASGVMVKSGDIYTGPAELVASLLSAGLLVQIPDSLDTQDCVPTLHTTDVVSEPKPKKKRVKKES